MQNKNHEHIFHFMQNKNHEYIFHFMQNKNHDIYFILCKIKIITHISFYVR
jgi:hypothetical protein